MNNVQVNSVFGESLYLTKLVMIKNCIRIILIVCLEVVAINVTIGQIDSNPTQQGSPMSPQVAAELAWLQDIYEHGVEIKGDSVYFNEETRRIASDSVYRNALYPKSYSWEAVPVLLNMKAVKPALWYMINLCYADKANLPLAMKALLPMDEMIQMDRALVAAYYTYISFDPDVYEMKNGKSIRVKRPDLAEQKLLATRSMVEQVQAQRQSAQSKGK